MWETDHQGGNSGKEPETGNWDCPGEETEAVTLPGEASSLTLLPPCRELNIQHSNGMQIFGQPRKVMALWYLCSFLVWIFFFLLPGQLCSYFTLSSNRSRRRDHSCYCLALPSNPRLWWGTLLPVPVLPSPSARFAVWPCKGACDFFIC